MEENKIIVFQDKKIRRILHENEWYFSVVDVVAALTDSPTPRQYWGKVKDREFLELEVSPIWVLLKLEAEDNKMRETDCANTENIFRIIQSIPSKKAEPFKRWLAKVGYERVQEIENPELAQERAKAYYEQKGYPKDWIEKRLRGIAIRQELTGEWKSRNVSEEKDFAILTDDIAKATFGVTAHEHKRIKNLDPKRRNQNLRDHMTDLELIFTMLGEKATTEITKVNDAESFDECRDAAQEGGSIAGNARKELESKTKKGVVSHKNYLHLGKKERKKLS